VQEKILLRILHRNRSCSFGLRHGFDRISSIKTFREQVPVRTWEEFAPLMDDAMRSGSPVLTARPVPLFQPTSGTSQSVKYIPSTPELKREFSIAVNVWLADLYRRFPAIARGQHYWSISPPAAQKAKAQCPGGTVGFDDDAEYLGWSGFLVRSVMAVPSSIIKAPTVDRFMQDTIAHLLLAEDLSLISVWNPTFLIVILSVLETHAEAVIRHMSEGGPGARRAKTVEKILGRYGILSADATAALWPNLAVLSCWADGASAEPAQRVRMLFPHAALQPKGLCATEGIISIPLSETGGATVAYTSHFLEFFPCDDGPVCTIDELDAGGAYRIVCTTGGGLYRYAMGDIVRVCGIENGLPSFVFTGRDSVCDLTGEKLHDHEVAAATTEALDETGTTAGFRLLSPEKDGDRFHYTLFAEIADDQDRQRMLAENLDRRLRRNFHYDYARNLGQLTCCRVARVDAGASRVYFERCLAGGMKAGDIKTVALDRRADWRERFSANPAKAGRIPCAS
jgi:hypothetical protein